eukprot:715909_1
MNLHLVIDLTTNDDNEINPWLIGQTIVSNRNETAVIKDYDCNTKLTQIIETLGDQHFVSRICLTNQTEWRAKETVFELPSSEFVPPTFKKHQLIHVRYDDGEWYDAVVDGYDPISRRHHVDYGDCSEWIWATKQKIKRIAATDNAEIKQKINTSTPSIVTSCPFDPVSYGLPEEFTAISQRIENERTRNTHFRNYGSDTKINRLKTRQSLKRCCKQINGKSVYVIEDDSE